jgi:hypothetical protein
MSMIAVELDVVAAVARCCEQAQFVDIAGCGLINHRNHGRGTVGPAAECRIADAGSDIEPAAVAGSTVLDEL